MVVKPLKQPSNKTYEQHICRKSQKSNLLLFGEISKIDYCICEEIAKTCLSTFEASMFLDFSFFIFSNVRGHTQGVIFMSKLFVLLLSSLNGAESLVESFSPALTKDQTVLWRDNKGLTRTRQQNLNGKLSWCIWPTHQ